MPGKADYKYREQHNNRRDDLLYQTKEVQYLVSPQSALYIVRPNVKIFCKIIVFLSYANFSSFDFM